MPKLTVSFDCSIASRHVKKTRDEAIIKQLENVTYKRFHSLSYVCDFTAVWVVMLENEVRNFG